MFPTNTVAPSSHPSFKATGGTCVEVRIQSSNKKEAPGKVWVEFFDRPKRIKRALKFLGFCWGGAIVAILLPLIHFVLVPALFIAGIVGTFVIYPSESVVLGGEGVCPSCGSHLPIVRMKNEWPLTDLCSRCRTSVTIIKKE